MCRSLAEGGRRCPRCGVAPGGHNASRRTHRTLGRLAQAGLHAHVGADDPEPHYWWDRGTGDSCAPSRLRPLRDPQSVMWKPHGGLWTSAPLSPEVPSYCPARAGTHTAWTDWVAGEEMHEDDAPERGNLTRVHPAPDAVIVRLSTPADLAAARRRWPHTVTTVIGERVEGFSYAAMARDGVHAVDVVPTEETSRPESLLYGFNVPSRIWLTRTHHRVGERTPLRW